MVVLNYVMVGNRIKSRRKDLDLTQKQLGKIVNLSEGSISKYESGKVEDVTTTKLNEFAEALNVDITWLLVGEKGFTYNHSNFDVSEDEQFLIASWRNLSHDNQMKITGIIEFMFDEESAAKENFESLIKRAGK